MLFEENNSITNPSNSPSPSKLEHNMSPHAMIAQLQRNQNNLKLKK